MTVHSEKISHAGFHPGSSPEMFIAGMVTGRAEQGKTRVSFLTDEQCTDILLRGGKQACQSSIHAGDEGTSFSQNRLLSRRSLSLRGSGMRVVWICGYREVIMTGTDPEPAHIRALNGIILGIYKKYIRYLPIPTKSRLIHRISPVAGQPERSGRRQKEWMN